MGDCPSFSLSFYLYHVYCTDIGIDYSPHFLEEGGFGHHDLFVFLSVCSLKVLACINIYHPKHLFLSLRSK